MTDLFNRLDFWISLIGAGLVVYLWGRRWWRRFTASGDQHREPTVQRYYYPEPTPPLASPRPEPRPPVPQPQYQNEPNQSVNFDAVLAWVLDNNLTDEQGIALIAAAHRLPGDYFLSANKIRDGVGGSRDEVLAQVAALRPRPPAKKIEAHLDRPANGWGGAVKNKP
jgi:hypothetical protein